MTEDYPVEKANFFSSIKHSKITLFAILAAVIVLVGIFLIYNVIIYRTEISDFELTASVADSSGVAPNSHFILKTTAPLSTQVLEKYIKIAPEVKFNIEKKSGEENVYEIIPQEDLQTDQIYTLQVDKGPLASHDFSWAYQIKAPFQVISSIPADKGVRVPLATGIELDFNRDNIIDPASFIEITPSVPGTFETVENKVRFIPKNPLAERTIYTVKIKSGLTAESTDDVFNGDTIIQFQTDQAYDQNRNYVVRFGRQFSEFEPGQDVVLGVNAYKASSVPLEIYRFDTAQDFLDSVTKIQNKAPWAPYYTNEDIQFSMDKKVLSVLVPLESQDYTSYFRVPQTLPTGYYAAIISSGGNKDISWFQVNSATSFISLASSKSLIWLKDGTNGRSLPDISITFNNVEVGHTGEDGVALFNTPAELIKGSTDYSTSYDKKYFIAQVPTGALVIPLEDQYGYSATLRENDHWWDYVSLNKNIYLPTDTVHFWAIAKPRSGNDVGGDVNVKLTNSYWGSGKDVITYGETTVKLSDYSTVTGELSFANLKPGVYALTFSQGDEVVAQQTVTVNAYIKPAYKITLIPDKTSLFAGQSVTFNIEAQFFDGTPVSDLQVAYDGYNSNQRYANTINLDSSGTGSFTLTPGYNAVQKYWPSYLSINVRPIGAESGYISTNSSVLVFGPHINNQINQKRLDTGDVSFAVKTRAVVPNKASVQNASYLSQNDYLGDPIPYATTQVNVSELVYLKNQTGTGYDAINKLTYPIYKYSTEERQISWQAIIADQEGNAEFSFSPEDKKTYKFTFTTYDDSGRTAVETRYVYGRGNAGYDTRNTSYDLFNNDNQSEYSIGDQFNLTLQASQGVAAPDMQKGYLFMTVNNGDILNYRIQDTPNYSATYGTQDLPNISVWPGWFAGNRFYNGYPENLSFNAEDRRLNITVAEDKQVYKPGDTVNLSVKVTDKNNQPVSAEVNLSALDEAVFSIRPNETNIVSDLYKDIYSQVVVRVSNMPPYGGGGAEKGGGDGDAVRSDIEEMAIFKTVTTDAGGFANVQFKLPDNITSWRLTSQATTKDLFVGKSINFIPVTLPFFVDATLNSGYLAGDQLILRLRAFGSSLSTLGDINYTAGSPTLPFKEVAGTGSSKVELSLGTLTSGSHELTVGVKSAGLSDSLKLSLNVLSSYFTQDTADFYQGSTGLKINNEALGYTTLTLSSYGRGQLYNQLKALSYQSGMRIDQKGSAYVATNLLNTFFGEQVKEPEFQVADYQSYTGGLQLLPYSSDDLELSALSAHVLKDTGIAKAQLQEYLSKSLTDAKSDVARISRALYGLSAFNAPVLTKIQNLKNEGTLTIGDKVFLALALNSLGAKEEARAYYKKEIKPSVVLKSSYAYVDGLNGDKTITTTALVAALTASLEEPESVQLALFVNQNFPKETLSNFERLLYIEAALPRLDSQDVSFSYSAGSKQGSETLNDGKTFRLTLSPSDLASFELSDVKGNLGITATYEKASSPESISKDKNLSLGRVYELNERTVTQFKEGDVVKVRLIPGFNWQALDGAYQIVDYLPSGLRPVDRLVSGPYDYSYSSRVYPSEVNGQKVTFVINKNTNVPVYYYARVVSKGTYKAEPATLQSLKSLDSITISDEDSVTIN
jgi:hypothetical protein